MPLVCFADGETRADLILSPSSVIGRKNLGQIWEMTHSLLLQKEALLRERGAAEVRDGATLLALLRRPQLAYDDLRAFDSGCAAFPAALAESVEIAVKYEGYIKRQRAEVAAFARLERRALPEDADYASIEGLRLEAREKLAAIRPRSLGQASRVSGVSPADVAALMIWLERRK